jgi:peptidoglycan/LPS O-acetylase OafA/YrhL
VASLARACPLKVFSNWVDLLLILLLGLHWAMPGADILIVPVFAVFIVRLCNPQVVASRVVGSAIPLFLGEISYSLYLVHAPVLLLRNPIQSSLASHGFAPSRVLALTILFGLSLPLSTAMFYYVEKPSRKWLRTAFERRRPERIVGDPAAP